MVSIFYVDWISNDVQIEFIEDYFRDNMLPFVQPVLLVEDRALTFLNNSALYPATYTHADEQ